MFDWVANGIRYLGWIIYVGMNYFISSIYNVLVTIPNNLGDIFNNETVNSLFNATRNLFFIFVGLMIVIIVVSRMFDWNINKMLGQIKKIFLLCLILIALPWIFNQTLTITNNFISSSNNVMISEENNTTETNLGVSLANIYIYKNEAYKSSSEYQGVDDNPFKKQIDLTDSEIINRKIKNDNGKEVYVYSYLNPILGLIMNLTFIILLVLTTFKIYGYLYNIIVIKIWVPIKMIYDGLNENPVSESIYEIINAFTSFAIQLIIIPFSVIMLNIFTDQVNGNIFLQLVSVLVALWFMFTGVDYIQTKFQGKSGVPTIIEAYSYAKLAQMGAKGVSNVYSGIKNTVSDNNFEKIAEAGNDDYINTGRENDSDMTNNEKENDISAKGTDVNTNPITSPNNDDDDENVNNVVSNENAEEPNTDINSENTNNPTTNGNEIVQGQNNLILNEDNIVANNDDVNLNKDEINNTNEEQMGGNQTNSGYETANPNPSSVNTTMPNKDNIQDQDIGNSEVRGANINNKESDDDSSIVNNHPSTNSYVGDINATNDIKYPATDKQVSYARSLGINVDGKDKYELGQEIENIKNGNQSNYTEPTWDKVEVNEKDVVSVEELENMLNEGVKDD